MSDTIEHIEINLSRQDRPKRVARVVVGNDDEVQPLINLLNVRYRVNVSGVHYRSSQDISGRYEIHNTERG